MTILAFYYFKFLLNYLILYQFFLILLRSFIIIHRWWIKLELYQKFWQKIYYLYLFWRYQYVFLFSNRNFYETSWILIICITFWFYVYINTYKCKKNSFEIIHTDNYCRRLNLNCRKCMLNLHNVLVCVFILYI